MRFDRIMHSMGRQCQRAMTYLNGSCIHFQLANASHSGINSDERMRECRSDRSQNCGVGEITLEARDRQLASHVVEQCIRQADVPFTVFEIDGIHLVWHGG